MPPAPSLQEVIHQVELDAAGDAPLGRLRAASALVRDLAEVGDAALGYFVDQARHAGHSWSEIGEALGVSKQAAQQKHTVRDYLGPNRPTFERFTPRARNVLAAAEPIARQWGHSFIGTEHLLLALYHEPEGIAAQVLEESGLTSGQARAAVEARVNPGSGAPDGPIAFTPNAKTVFTEALASALELGHNYIGTEHLLLGVVRVDGVATEALGQAGLTPDAVVAKVVERLAGYGAGRRTAKAAAKRAASTIPRPGRAPSSRQRSG